LIRRQLDRLSEEGIEVEKVPWRPVETLAERLAARVDERTAAAMVSSVLFGSGLVVSLVQTLLALRTPARITSSATH